MVVAGLANRSIAEWIGLEADAEGWMRIGAEGGGLLVLALACVLAYLVARGTVGRVVERLVARSRNEFDDLFVTHGVFRRLSHIAPALVLNLATPLFHPAAAVVLQRAGLVYIAIVGVATACALLNVFVDYASRVKSLSGKPIRGYVQTIKIFLVIIGTILVLAALMDKSPWKLISGIGAVSAILLLVFKDSILGLVASIQISAYDMVKVGDWIEMPKFGADGDVLEVSLHTVKVRNWDKTITTIPTLALVSDSFKNWRGMQEIGGRRIKRAIHIDMNSVGFCDEPMLDRFTRFDHLGDYIRERREEVDAWNREHAIDKTHLLNGRRLTNLGCFRAYVLGYLRDHPALRQDLTLLVRQLAPTDRGLPLELYVFTADTRWAVYESIQADIFDHLLAAIQEFDLRVFQAPGGEDFERIGTNVGPSSDSTPRHPG